MSSCTSRLDMPILVALQEKIPYSPAVQSALLSASSQLSLLVSFQSPFQFTFLPLLQSTPTRLSVALACLGERLTGSDTRASPEHLLHVPLPAFSCTSTPCTTCHPQQLQKCHGPH